MLDPFSLEMVVEARQRTALQRAAHERVLRTVRRHWAPRRRLDRRIAQRLGKRLVGWGATLQAYATAPGGEPSALLPARRTARA